MDVTATAVQRPVFESPDHDPATATGIMATPNARNSRLCVDVWLDGAVVTGRAMTKLTTRSHRPFAVFGRTKISDSNPGPTTVWTVYAARPLSALLSCGGV